MEHERQVEALPLVSLIIVYYKRREIVEEAIGSVLRQDYPNRELIVVDNHSQDDLRQLIQGLNNSIRIIELPENLGAAAGRNVGIRAARGDILVFLDDDAAFASPFELTKIVKTFEARPSVHVLAFQICDPHTGRVRLREWCHPRPYEQFADAEFETNHFCEGASASRRQVFDVCGLYYEPLFYGPEGHDLKLRVLDHNFRILYAPQIRVTHWASERGGRSSSRQYYYFTRDFIWMAYKDYPLWDGLLYLFPKLLMMLYFAWRTSSYKPVMKGLWDGVRGLPHIRADRTPISKKTIRYLHQLEKWRPSLMARLARHRKAPQI